MNVAIEQLKLPELEAFLCEQADDAFPSLKDEQRLHALAEKWLTCAEFCTCRDANGMLVGMIAFYANQPETATAYIPHVYVSKTYRGQGIFSNMFHFIVDYVSPKGFSAIRLEVDKNNIIAQQSYLHRGFHFCMEAGENTLYMEYTTNKPQITLPHINPTECERIINQGILPSDFLTPEVRCDFLVTQELKKIWAVALDTLMEFDRVCRKHQLRYFLAYGSMLGAVRHNGFIPWDDDMDVFMLRKDYDKLLALGGEFSHPYFLQTPQSDPGYFFSYAKLRNSRTTCITTQFRYQKINWGQNFDIFPLDNFKLERGDAYYERLAVLGTDLSNYMRSSNPNPPTEDERRRIESYSGRPPMEIYDEIQRMATQYNNEDTGLLAVTSAYLYGFQKGVFRREDFSEAMACNFEGVTSYIPNGYDRILSTIYGDYMKFPPVEKRGIWHGNIIYDPDVSYLEIQRRDGIVY